MRVSVPTAMLMHGYKKIFDTVVVLEEKKCHLKHFLGRLKVKSHLKVT